MERKAQHLGMLSRISQGQGPPCKDPGIPKPIPAAGHARYFEMPWRPVFPARATELMCVFQKNLPVLGQCCAFSMPFYQLRAQFRLKTADMLGKSRNGIIQFHGGFCEGLFFCECDKRDKLFGIHGNPPFQAGMAFCFLFYSILKKLKSHLKIIFKKQNS